MKTETEPPAAVVRSTRRPWLDGVEFKTAAFSGARFPPHFHDLVSIGCVESGFEALSCGGQKLTVPSNVLVVLDAGQVHAHQAVSQGHWRYRVLYVSPDLFASRARALGRQLHRAQTLVNSVSLVSHFFSLHRNESDPARVLALVDALLDYRHPHQQLVDETMDEVAELLRAHRGPLRMDRLAAQFRENPWTLVRRFQRCHGLTPNAYQLVHRIEQSRALLASGMPIVDVALSVGFFDQAHFTRFFKRYCGVPPARFQRHAAVV